MSLTRKLMAFGVLATAGLIAAAGPAAGASPHPFALVPAPGSPYATAGAPIALVAADFDRDGHTDLLTADTTGPASVSLLRGAGAAGFGPPPVTIAPALAGGSPHAITSADFDGDGDLDLAVIDYASGAVTVLLGDGHGGVQPGGSAPSVGPFGGDVMAADVNGDGRPDLAVAGGGALSVLLGDGHGDFTASGSLAAGDGYPAAVAVADLDGDGHPDLAGAGYQSSTVPVALGDGTGALTASPVASARTRYNPGTIAVGDLDGDGHQDVAAASSSGVLQLLLGDGRGRLTVGPNPSVAAAFAPDSLIAADLDGDGRTDLATAGRTSSAVSVFFNRARSTWSAPWISGPRRCFSGGRARFTVRGASIRAVQFTFDRGRRSIDLSHPNAPHDGFRVSLPTKALRPGIHTLRAFVMFTPDDGGRVLSAPLRRCAARRR